MSDFNFTDVLNDLENVEKELKKAGDNKEIQQACCDRLLELRGRMDCYVEHWLRFEEKINELQETYGFLLPDELPESFVKAFNSILPEKEMENEFGLKEEKRCLTQPLSLRVENEACIRSFRRGLGFMELAMMDEAIAEFRQVVILEPDLLLAHLCLGVAYAERGKEDEAMRELRLVQALTSESQTRSIVHNALGNLYAGREEYDQAVPEFEKAVELDPEFTAAYFNLGAAYYNIKEYEKSLEAFLRTREKFQRDWEIYFYLGKVCKRLGNEKEALENLLISSHLAPHQPFVSFELGLVYESLGETRKALECYCRAKKLYQEQEAEGQRVR